MPATIFASLISATVAGLYYGGAIFATLGNAMGDINAVLSVIGG